MRSPQFFGLPVEITEYIKSLRRERLLPNWIIGEMPKGPEVARRCLVIAKDWQCEDKEAFQDALAKLDGNESM